MSTAPIRVKPTTKPTAKRKPVAPAKRPNPMGPQVAFYRSRSLGWRDAFIVLIPGLLGVLAPNGYAIWLYGRTLQQHGPAAAEQWSQPWFWLAWGALAVFILLCILRLLDLRRFAAVHTRGVLLRPGILRIYSLQWKQISGVALSATQTVFFHKRGRARLRAVIFPNQGRQIRLDERLQNLAELISRVKASLYPRLLPDLKASFQAGKWLYFGPVALQAKALRLQHAELTWEQVEDLQVENGYLAVSWRKGPGTARTVRIPISKIPNLELLLQIIREGVNV
jgi:Family of unknown function (DUF6585)